MQQISSSSDSNVDMVELTHLDMMDRIKILMKRIELITSSLNNRFSRYNAQLEVHRLKLMARKLSIKSLHFRISINLSEILSQLTKLINFNTAVIFKNTEKKVLKIKALTANSGKVQNIYPLNIKNSQENVCPA